LSAVPALFPQNHIQEPDGIRLRYDASLPKRTKPKEKSPRAQSDDPALWEMVRMLAERANMPMPRVYVSPAAAPNAFATGRNPRHSAVCVTVGLRQLLNDEELAGVVAHELAHVRHRDILISTVAAVVAGAITVLAYMAFFFGGDDDEGSPLVGLLMIIFAPMAAGLIQMAISRSREYEADRAAAELVGSPRGLARALQKLAHGSSRIPLAVPDVQTNMFIVAPLTGHRAAKLFMTHPPRRKPRRPTHGHGQIIHRSHPPRGATLPVVPCSYAQRRGMPRTPSGTILPRASILTGTGGSRVGAARTNRPKRPIWSCSSTAGGV